MFERTGKHLALILVLMAGFKAAVAQHVHSGPPDDKPAVLLPGTGDHNHPITTRSEEARKFFNQGLALLYGFNRGEALKSFRRAAELDPRAAMAYWGMAMAMGPHINVESDGDMQPRAAREAIDRALSLLDGVSENEGAYIRAASLRFSADPAADLKALDRQYSRAMGEVAHRWPDDLDASTLYAESLMNLSRWNWWSSDGRPAEGTEEAIAVLERVLRRHPNHAGANHFYIHAVEASPNPERGINSAVNLMGANPGLGHMVHMPGHIYLRIGDYEMAAVVNQLAVNADRQYTAIVGEKADVYTAGYITHNRHFIVVARAAQGRYQAALEAARELTAVSGRLMAAMPEMADYFAPNPLYVMLRFNRWDEILAEPAPDSRLAYTRAIRHFARALALAAHGRAREAGAERRAFEEAAAAVPSQQLLSFNSARSVLKIAGHVLAARLAGSDSAAIQHWTAAVEAQDSLRFDEPPPWYYPVRESLGAALLRSGRPAEAEAVFREDLRRNLRNPRSLFGLLSSLRALNRQTDAEWVRQEFERAWKHAEVELRIEDY